MEGIDVSKMTPRTVVPVETNGIKLFRVTYFKVDNWDNWPDEVPTDELVTHFKNNPVMKVVK